VCSSVCCHVTTVLMLKCVVDKMFKFRRYYKLLYFEFLDCVWSLASEGNAITNLDWSVVHSKWRMSGKVGLSDRMILTASIVLLLESAVRWQHSPLRIWSSSLKLPTDGNMVWVVLQINNKLDHADLLVLILWLRVWNDVMRSVLEGSYHGNWLEYSYTEERFVIR
jgi:hypothetical protein